MMAFSVGSDGKLRGSIAGSHRDGDFVVSGGYFSSFFEGLDMLGSLGDTINPPPLPPADNPTQYSDEDQSKDKHEANHSDNEPEDKQEQPLKVKTPAPKPAAPKVPASKPLSALAKAYIKAGLEINQFDISEQEKQSLKKQVFAKLQEFEQASVHNKQALLDSWHEQTLAAKPRQSWWQQAADKLVNWFGVPESEAAVPIAIGTVKVIGMVIGALVLAKAVEWKENRPKVFITPIHKEKPIIYSTPEHKQEYKDKGFEVSDDPAKDQGYSTPEYDSTLPGFIPVEIDGINILYNIKIDGNGKVDIGNLDADHEGGSHKGHTVERHVDKDIQYLQSRNLKSASSYSDEETDRKITQEVLQKNVKDLSTWDQNTPIGEKESFRATFNYPIGYGINKGESSLSLRYKATVWVRKTSNGLKIITSYPIE